MELLESDDHKTHLLRQAANQKQALNEDLKLITDKTEKVLKNALIIGGALAATYLIYTMLSDSGPKKKRRKVKVVRAAEEDDEVEEVQESSAPSVISKI